MVVTWQEFQQNHFSQLSQDSCDKVTKLHLDVQHYCLSWFRPTHIFTGVVKKTLGQDKRIIVHIRESDGQVQPKVGLECGQILLLSSPFTVLRDKQRQIILQPKYLQRAREFTLTTAAAVHILFKCKDSSCLYFFYYIRSYFTSSHTSFGTVLSLSCEYL